MGSRLFDEDEVKKRTIGGKKLATKHKKLLTTLNVQELMRGQLLAMLGLLLGTNQYNDDNMKNEQL